MRSIKLANTDKVAIVDDEDYDRLIKYKWHLIPGKSTFYARSSFGAYMHNIILDIIPTFDRYSDHIDGDGLNNRKSNLRICNPSQNGANARKQENTTSIYKGVSWYKAGQQWQAHIYPNRKSIYLGRFDSEEEAALAYNEAAILHYGEFARLNEV